MTHIKLLNILDEYTSYDDHSPCDYGSIYDYVLDHRYNLQEFWNKCDISEYMFMVLEMLDLSELEKGAEALRKALRIRKGSKYVSIFITLTVNADDDIDCDIIREFIPKLLGIDCFVLEHS